MTARSGKCQGFSLPEVLVAVGILGIAVLVLTTALVQSQNQSAQIEGQAELFEQMQLVEALLYDVKLCSANMKNRQREPAFYKYPGDETTTSSMILCESPPCSATSDAIMKKGMRFKDLVIDAVHMYKSGRNHSGEWMYTLGVTAKSSTTQKVFEFERYFKAVAEVYDPAGPNERLKECIGPDIPDSDYTTVVDCNTRGDSFWNYKSTPPTCESRWLNTNVVSTAYNTQVFCPSIVRYRRLDRKTASGVYYKAKVHLYPARVNCQCAIGTPVAPNGTFALDPATTVYTYPGTNPIDRTMETAVNFSRPNLSLNYKKNSSSTAVPQTIQATAGLRNWLPLTDVVLEEFPPPDLTQSIGSPTAGCSCDWAADLMSTSPATTWSTDPLAPPIPATCAALSPRDCLINYGRAVATCGYDQNDLKNLDTSP